MFLTGIFGEIFGAICGLYVANSIPSWHIPIIVADTYLLYLPYANATIVVAGILKILMHLFPWFRLKMVFEELAQFVALYALSMLITFFPFDFSVVGRPEVNALLMVGLRIAIVGVGIACIITFVRFLKGKP